MRWGDVRLEVSQVGWMLAKMNREGKELPEGALQAIIRKFSLSVAEMEILETYLFFVSEGFQGADYLSAQEMEKRIEGKYI